MRGIRLGAGIVAIVTGAISVMSCLGCIALFSAALKGTGTLGGEIWAEISTDPMLRAMFAYFIAGFVVLLLLSAAYIVVGSLFTAKGSKGAAITLLVLSCLMGNIAVIVLTALYIAKVGTPEEEPAKLT